jgi:hypothetical protein
LTTGVSVPAEEIQFTRGLLFASVVQALHAAQHFGDKKGLADCYQLDPHLQKKVAIAYLGEKPPLVQKSGDIVNQIVDSEWIRENTGGTPMPGVSFDSNQESSKLTR